MSLTVSEYITNTRNMMDAETSERWSDEFIRTVLGYVYVREYSGLLGATPYYKFQQTSVSTNASGQFSLDDLNTGSGDSAKYWHRILAITDGQSVYRETQFMDVPLGTANTAYNAMYMWSYYLAGDNVQVLPVTSGLALTVSTNYRPPSPSELSAVSVAVSWPSGHESVLWLMAGAELLTKGGTEVEAASDLRSLAGGARTTMYQDIARRTARPLFMGYPDNSSDWGGR